MGDYAIAYTGIIDNAHETLPVRAIPSVNEELPAITTNLLRPAASKLNLTITVSGLSSGVQYNLYKYNSYTKIPTSSFNANANNAVRKWLIVGPVSSSSVTLVDGILSSDQAIYRCVPSAGP